MKVHRHTRFCLICLLTFVFHQCHHCHEGEHSHNDCQISENQRTEPEPSKEAEVKQKYYIEKLFNRYGENGKLSFCGLEKLMMSLGLGEIKIVEINHEDIGHDYVSYLDVLDTQEGKHSHSHNHPHSHNHRSSENQTANEGSGKRSQKCDPVKEVTELSLKPDGTHAHDSNNHRHHKHHHRRHAHRHVDHNNTHQSHNDSINASDHGEPSHEPSTETNATQEHPEGKLHKLPKKRRKMKNREVSRVTAQDFILNHDSNEQYEHNHVHKHDHVHDGSFAHARFHEHNNDHSATHGHQDPNPASGDGYRHTSKREAPDKQISVGKHANHKNHNEDEHSSEEVCMSPKRT